MATPEGKVKDKIRRILKSHGAWFCMPATHGYGASGTPDLLVCYQGVFIGIECKAGKNKPTTLQERAIQQIRAAGGIAEVINDVDTQAKTEAVLDAARRQAG